MQSQSSSPSRNPASAAGIPNKVSAPNGPVTLGKDPKTGNGQTMGSGIRGFDGGLIPGKV